MYYKQGARRHWPGVICSIRWVKANKLGHRLGKGLRTDIIPFYVDFPISLLPPPPIPTPSQIRWSPRLVAWVKHPTYALERKIANITGKPITTSNEWENNRSCHISSGILRYISLFQKLQWINVGVPIILLIHIHIDAILFYKILHQHI